MLDSLTKKQKIIFFILLGTMLCVILYYAYLNFYSDDLLFLDENTNNYDINNLIENTDINISNISNLSENKIVVYICGAVKNSQVVTLNENSRVYDAIEAAGGLLDNADLFNINLANILEDGEKIYIPKIGEEINNEDISSSNNTTNKKININTANQTLLETIPGIGPSTALKIINYRKENGKFTKIEDIKNIPGIGDKKFENIKDYITIK